MTKRPERQHFLDDATPPASGGEATLALPGGGDVFYEQPGEALLAAARAQPELCLHHATKTRADHLRDLTSTAWIQTIVLGLVPLWLAASGVVGTGLRWFAPGTLREDSLGFWALVFPVWALASWGLARALVYVADSRSAYWGWERRTVLHLATRCCVGEHTLQGRYPRTSRHVWPLSDLAVCYRARHDGESGGTTHDLLLVLQQPPRPGASDTIVCLHQGRDTWQAAHALGRALAGLWHIPFLVRD